MEDKELKLKKAKYMKTFRKRKIAQGFCNACLSRKARQGRSNCEKCFERQKKYILKSKRKMQKNMKDPAYMAAINEKIRIGLMKGL